MASPASLPRRATRRTRPLIGPSSVAKKPNGPLVGGEPAPGVQHCAAPARRFVPLGRMTPQSGDEGFVLAPIGGDADEIVVGESDQRRFQGGREGEIVLAATGPRGPPRRDRAPRCARRY